VPAYPIDIPPPCSEQSDLLKLYFPISNSTSFVDSAVVSNCILSDSSSSRHRKDSFEYFEPRTLDGEKEMQIVSAEISNIIWD
jgi:hypothetical protein